MDFCSLCGKAITHGKYWITVDSKFHVECFRCAECHNLLLEGDTCLKKGKYYCRKDFLKKWGILCKSCGKYLNSGEQYLEFDGNSYHNVCMTCSVCSSVIYIGSKFYTTSNAKRKLLCEVCVSQNHHLLDSTEHDVYHEATSVEFPSDPAFPKTTSTAHPHCPHPEDTVDSSAKSVSSSLLIGGNGKQRKQKYASVMKGIFGASFDLLL